MQNLRKILECVHIKFNEKNTCDAFGESIATLCVIHRKYRDATLKICQKCLSKKTLRTLKTFTLTLPHLGQYSQVALLHEGCL